MSFLALACSVSAWNFATNEIKPKLIEPVNYSTDEITITDIDSIPGYSIGEDKVVAVGVWYDVANGEYVIFVMEIADEGVSYSVTLAFKF